MGRSWGQLRRFAESLVKSIDTEMKSTGQVTRHRGLAGLERNEKQRFISFPSIARDATQNGYERRTYKYDHTLCYIQKSGGTFPWTPEVCSVQ